MVRVIHHVEFDLHLDDLNRLIGHLDAGLIVALDKPRKGLERQNLDIMAVHEALGELARQSPRQSQVVTLRFFGRFTVENIAGMLDVSVSTVESDWRMARAWLFRELQGAQL